jgi:hypothetical protein
MISNMASLTPGRLRRGVSAPVPQGEEAPGAVEVSSGVGEDGWLELW